MRRDPGEGEKHPTLWMGLEEALTLKENLLLRPSDLCRVKVYDSESREKDLPPNS